MLRAFKRAQAAVSLPVLEGALALADAGRLSQISDISAALLEKELSGPAPALSTAHRRQSLRLAASAGLSSSLGATQAAAGKGAAAALCKKGVGMAKPLPSGAKGAVINGVIKFRQQGLSYAQIAEKFNWSTTKVHAIIKDYAPQLLKGPIAVSAPAPVTLPKPAPRTVPSGRSITIPENPGDLRSLTTREWGLLGKEQAEALGAYKRAGYRRINEYLRYGERVAKDYTKLVLKQTQESIAHLDKVFFRLENDLTVWRGGWDVSTAKVGQIFSDNAYVSTSLSREVARGFTTAGEDILWKIKVPRGARVSLPCCTHMDELEILLARGSKLRITGIVPGGQVGGMSTPKVIQAVLVI